MGLLMGSRYGLVIADVVLRVMNGSFNIIQGSMFDVD